MSDNQGHLHLAHEVNKELLDLLTYRSERRFLLSAGLLAVKVGVIGLLVRWFSKAHQWPTVWRTLF